MKIRIKQGADPLLQKPFSFYGTKIKMNLEDMVGVMKDKMLNYY